MTHTFLITMIVNGVTKESSLIGGTVTAGYDYFPQIAGHPILGVLFEWKHHVPNTQDGQAIGTRRFDGVRFQKDLDEFAEVIARVMKSDMPFEFSYTVSCAWQRPAGFPEDRNYGYIPSDACAYCGRSAKRIGDGKLHGGMCSDHRRWRKNHASSN